MLQYIRLIRMLCGRRIFTERACFNLLKIYTTMCYSRLDVRQTGQHVSQVHHHYRKSIIAGIRTYYKNNKLFFSLFVVRDQANNLFWSQSDIQAYTSPMLPTSFFISLSNWLVLHNFNYDITLVSKSMKPSPKFPWSWLSAFEIIPSNPIQLCVSVKLS